MSLVSGRMDFDSTSSPSPVQHKTALSDISESRYSNCQYHHGKYCMSKICTVVVLLIFTTVAGLTMTSMALWFDNWAGISTNPYATLDLPYPRLGSKHHEYITFNKTIPNDNGTLYKYVDDGGENIRYITSRYGLFSHCKTPVQGPRIALFRTPWKGPVCKASRYQFQCPIVAMRTTRGEVPWSPRSRSVKKDINGCIKSTQVCDGVIDCPTGHDELNCVQPEEPCGPGMIQCSAEKPICIAKSRVCDGVNDCGMFEDEQNCCGRVSFLRCGDGTCVMGERCDAKAQCFDKSDEYDCPAPSSKYYKKCNDGQLIESRFACEKREDSSFQCTDFSDEMECEFDPKPLSYNPAIKSFEYDKHEKCFKQSFTFKSLNQSQLEYNYHDKKQREFMKEYEYSNTRVAIIASMGISAALCVASLALLFCFGNLNRKCKIMRRTFLALAIIYFLCISQTLLTGIFWVKYVRALNDVVQNPSIMSMYEQVAIETVKVTGGLATIRISTQLTFYNCGFFGLAMILCIIASQLLRNASCHTHGSISFSGDYKRNMYSDDQLTANGLLLGGGSSSNSGGTATPDQMVSPQKSFRSYDPDCSSRSATLPFNPTSYSRNHINGANTYISYRDIDSIDKLSHQLTISTLDTRGTMRSTQV